MTILIAYATTDGHTRKIARFCADHLSARHSVELLNLDDSEGLDLSRFQGIILAGSVHVHNFQRPLVAFAKANAAILQAKPSLFLAVSLSAAGKDADDLQGLRDCHTALEAETGWVPGTSADVAGAFRFTEYDYFKAWMMKRIAVKKGQEVDENADREFTDWAALARLVDQWAAGQFATVQGLVGDDADSVACTMSGN